MCAGLNDGTDYYLRECTGTTVTVDNLQERMGLNNEITDNFQ
jgi:hypothetical protein